MNACDFHDVDKKTKGIPFHLKVKWDAFYSSR